jgi:hypothetical protein
VAEDGLVDQLPAELELERFGLAFRRAGREPSENTMSLALELDEVSAIGELADGQKDLRL